MGTLAKLTAAKQPSAISAIATSILVPPASPRRVYVLLTTCVTKPAAIDEDQLTTTLGQQPRRSQQIDVIHIGNTCTSPIPTIVRDSGGAVIDVANANGLAMAADRVSRDLLGQYQLAFATNPAHGAVTVEVSAMQVHAQASIRASTQWLKRPATTASPTSA